MRKTDISRRQFLVRTAAVAGGLVASPIAARAAAYAPKRTAVDQMTLGHTGVKLSRLGFGTGTKGGSVQRALGQDGFTRLLRYGYDQGITYIDTAQAYRTHEMVGQAIKGLPREKLFIQSKMPGTPENPLEVLDRYRKELGVEYIDSLLVHCVVEADWDERRKRILDALQEAKDKQIIRAHGVSCHSLPALKRSVELDWVDVHLVRINPQGVLMDTPSASWNARSDASHVPPVMEQVKLMREKKRGVIGMKLIGEGAFVNAEDREKAIRFTMQSDATDAVVIGFKSTGEIDEAIARINSALAV
ncbi:MAG: aldo/keto reductase [Sedimentisphaerales bacterium]|nr:aldo/keto reductase [Sedimentisphaerales bacterium]